MKVRVRDVVSSGLRLEQQLKPEELGLGQEEFLDPDNPIKVAADLKRVDDFILARVTVGFVAEYHCARCLERLSEPAGSTYELEIEVKPGQEWFDLGELIREEMLMGFTPRVLCREDCRGICPDCGADLNTECCECQGPRQRSNQKE